MQKIISLIAALMIFAFSFLGEDVHVSSSCSDSAIVQSANSGVCGATITAMTKAHSDAAADFGVSMHDCHFGHCAFTLLLPAQASTPNPLVGKGVVRLHAFIQSGFRSETLRPPSLA
ncbi:MAG: hypothetical protein JST04_03980 [Bdellovibrionales bacterium]|nr:hypothetical protein [Bdellovibrionales bacterium]